MMVSTPKEGRVQRPTHSSTNNSMPPSVAPPTPQEIQRKLSVHSASRAKPSTTSGPSLSNISNTVAPGTSWGTTGLVSGTESDSDSILTPDITSIHAGFNPASTSIMQPPLSSIAERNPGSGGEDTDEEDDDAAGWRAATEGPRTGGGTAGAGSQTRAADVVLKSGYLSKKGERRKTWKKRWFVLRPTHLAFYKNEAEYKLLRLLDLNDVHSCVPVQLKRHANVFGLILPKRTYYLQAGSPGDVRGWVEAIEDARQTLMATSTQNSGNNGSTPIPIPYSSTTGTRPPPISVSPQQQNANTLAQLVSSSDSEDAMSHLAPPPPIGGSGGGGDRGGGGLVAPSPTNVTFSVSPTANKPQVGPMPASPGPKDVSAPSKIILSGYLMKCGSKRRNWRKRWFVLTAERLFYSRSHMDTKPHRVFSLSDILDAMDYELPKHRSHHHHSGHHHHHHAPAGLTTSLSTSLPPPHLSSSAPGGEGVLGTSVGTTTSSSLGAGPMPSTPGGVDLGGTETLQQGGRNFTFKIVMTKKHLLLCAPSEEDEIKWLGAVRALIARRSVGQQPAIPVGGVTEGVAVVGSGVGGGAVAAPGGGGGGIKSKVRRLSAGAGVLGKSSAMTSAVATTGGTVIGGGGGDETRDAR